MLFITSSTSDGIPDVLNNYCDICHLDSFITTPINEILLRNTSLDKYNAKSSDEAV